MGGDPREAEDLQRWTETEGLKGLDVRGVCTESELDTMLVVSKALVQPSLEEGYGLPAVEAAAAGLPVIATPTGYALEIPAALVTFVDALDEASIAAGIDEAVRRERTMPAWLPRSTLGMIATDSIPVALADAR